MSFISQQDDEVIRGALELILLELKKMNFYLSIMTDVRLDNEDVEDG